MKDKIIASKDKTIAMKEEEIKSLLPITRLNLTFVREENDEWSNEYDYHDVSVWKMDTINIVNCIEFDLDEFGVSQEVPDRCECEIKYRWGKLVYREYSKQCQMFRAQSCCFSKKGSSVCKDNVRLALPPPSQQRLICDLD